MSKEEGPTGCSASPTAQWIRRSSISSLCKWERILVVTNSVKEHKLKTNRKPVGASLSSSLSSCFTVDFLTTSCGLTPAQALSAAGTIHMEEKRRRQPESVVALLHSHGFIDAQISEVVARSPRVLLSKAEEKLGPKLRFLTRAGLSTELIARRPSLLRHSLDRHIRPCFEFLRCFLVSAEDVRTMFWRHKWFLDFDLKSTLIPNVSFLLELGIAAPAISRLMVTHPRSLMKKHEWFAEIVQIVQDWGVKPGRRCSCMASATGSLRGGSGGARRVLLHIRSEQCLQLAPKKPWRSDHPTAPSTLRNHLHRLLNRGTRMSSIAHLGSSASSATTILPREFGFVVAVGEDEEVAPSVVGEHSGGRIGPSRRPLLLPLRLSLSPEKSGADAGFHLGILAKKKGIFFPTDDGGSAMGFRRSGLRRSPKSGDCRRPISGDHRRRRFPAIARIQPAAAVSGDHRQPSLR
ncbi:hypothetical protein Taro_010044 [Colocasia esculenta]|uniref:Uncharacterized protein n=1 Tax=Colocasia esculenta TaxID=4460 RepID=A0A843U6K9_COLES|nr:hypothetical protein [Colocasia esculenta]